MRPARPLPLLFLSFLVTTLLLSCGAEEPGFSFAVVSDSHTGGTLKTGKLVYKRLLEQINEQKPDLVVHCGDWIVGPSYDQAGDATADTFLTYTALLDSAIAFYPVLGNHEGDYEDYTYSMELFPDHFVNGGWYSFDHKRAHFFIIENNSDASDSTLRGYRSCRPNGGINTPESPQREWLDADLAGRPTDTRWTFGFGHRSYYGAEGYSGRKNVYEGRGGEGAICRVMEDAGVAVFFNGDQHCYTRSPAIRGGERVPAGDSTTVYLTCGGAGGRIDRGSKREPPLTFPFLDELPEGTFETGFKDHYFYLLCRVTETRFHADVIDTSGALLDSFTIQHPLADK